MPDSDLLPATPSDAPLADLRVLDLSRIVAGPYVGMLLADLGATVLKVESPRDPDAARAWGPPFLDPNGHADLAPHFAMANRGKALVELDFHDAADRLTLEQLVARADVVIENFRPGALARQGLAADSFLQRHPRLIWCSVTGYGDHGPLAPRAGYDAIAQAASGLMSLSGDAESGPMKTAAPIVDQTTGLFAAIGVLAALARRERTGRGGHVGANLFASALSLAGPYNLAALGGKEAAALQGNTNPFISPFGRFLCAEDTYLMLTVGSDAQFKVFAEHIGLDARTRQRFAAHASRKDERCELEAAIATRLGARAAPQWEAELASLGIACSAVNSVAQGHAHPQARALALLQQVQGIPQVATPVFLDRLPVCAQLRPPGRGQALSAGDALRALE